MEEIETIIVGGGQAGLVTSYHLKRWDSFTLVTPNWSVQLPGAHYDGHDPDGFMPKDEIVVYFERYAERFDLPVRFRTPVLEVAPMGGNRCQVKTEAKPIKPRM